MQTIKKIRIALTRETPKKSGSPLIVGVVGATVGAAMTGLLEWTPKTMFPT